jgi:hypothetical protein
MAYPLDVKKVKPEEMKFLLKLELAGIFGPRPSMWRNINPGCMSRVMSPETSAERVRKAQERRDMKAQKRIKQFHGVK